MIVTIDYYKNDFKGYVGNLSDEDVERNIKAAEQLVNMLTHYRLVNGQVDYNTLPVYMQDAIKQSICMLTEYYITNGGYQVVQQQSESNVQSATVGKFSYSNGNGNSGKTSIEDGIPVMVLELLANTGLMYNGIAVSGYVY